mgnify:CR=1 FL=1
MTDKNNRFLQGIVVAFIFHFLIAILLGLFEFHSNNYSPKILEILPLLISSIINT